MAKNDLGETEVLVLGVYQNLSWWSVKMVQKATGQPGARQATERLWKRGFLTRFQVRSLLHDFAPHYIYRMTEAGIDAYWRAMK